MKLQSLNVRRIIASSATIAVILGAAGGLLAPANASTTGCGSDTCTATFSFSGTAETFTVPTNVTALTFAVSGAQGGAALGFLPGGNGATVSGVLPVTPGQQLTALVGQTGAQSGPATFGGGGASPSIEMASGGGGSFIFDATGQPLVAAGGGGGAGLVEGPSGGVGAGADGTGGNGVGIGYSGETPPTGGSPTAGGSHGSTGWSNGNDGSGPAADGLPGKGGDGGGNNVDAYYPGSGGGGGFYGGGGGAYAQAGGGGSGYADPSITSLTSTDGAQGGNGVILLSWALQASTVTLSQSPSAGSTQGDSVTLSSSVSGAFGTATGTVEFDANGGAIAGCSAQPLTSGTATCVTTTLAPGTDSLQAAYSGDTLYAASNSDTNSYPVAYPALSVTTSSLPSGRVDGAYSADLSATGGLAPYSWTVTSGALPTGLTLSTSGTISGTPSAADSGASFTVKATDDQGTAYTATAPLSIVVDQASQAIDFTSTVPSGAAVGDSYSVAATGGNSGLDVTFTVDGSTTNSACSISGSTVSFDHAGTCVVDADQAGNDDYSAAPTAQQEIGVGTAAQGVNFTSTAPASASVGDSYSVAATGGNSGLDVTFTVDGSTTNSACSISGSTVSFDHAGTCVVDADQAGNDDYSAAPTAQQEIGVGTAAQVVTFTSAVPTPAVAGTHDDVTTTGGASGNTVTLSVDASTTNSACSIDGSTVSFDHAGTCVVDADQAGNDDYSAAPTAQQEIDVTKVGSAVTVTSSATPSVFGQGTHATATVTDGGGTPQGTVQFAIDGTDFGSPVTLADGSAQSPGLTTPGGGSLAPGAHAVTASYSPSDSTVFAGASNSTTQVVDQAATTTAVTVHATSISATVSAVAPGAGGPSGNVTFKVAGQSVGTANVVDGVATLSYTVANGMTRTVAAIYAGDDSFTGSSDSTSRSDPSITATVSSAHAKTHAGWYRTPVTVTFHCATNGAPLTGPCPDAVQFAANGAGQSTTRTIAATDGGVATVTVSGINVDHTAPSVKVTGIKNGAGYGGKAPTAHCVAHDALSGVASCTITRHTSGTRTSYTARATDKAGNTTTIHGSYHVLSIYIQGAKYSDGAFTVHTGHSYTLVVTDQAGRPTYYDAAIYPHKPTQREVAFHAAGHHRWALGVTFTRSMRSHHYWNLGVKVGHTMHKVKVHVEVAG